MDTEALTDRDKSLIALSQSTGLSVLTCEDLLKKGWTFQSDKDKPRVWLGPEFQLTKRQTR